MFVFLSLYSYPKNWDMRGDRNRTPKWKTHSHLQRLYKQHILHTVFFYIFPAFLSHNQFFITNISTYSFIDSHKQPSWSIWKKYISNHIFINKNASPVYSYKWLFIGKCLELVSSAMISQLSQTKIWEPFVESESSTWQTTGLFWVDFVSTWLTALYFANLNFHTQDTKSLLSYLLSQCLNGSNQSDKYILTHGFISCICLHKRIAAFNILPFLKKGQSWSLK